MCSQHKRTNHISAIFHLYGNFVSQPEAMVEVFDDYFQYLFKITDLSIRFVDCCLKKIPTHVTFEMNAVLLERRSSEEVKQALDRMAPFKLPGLMGLVHIFMNLIGMF